MGFIEELYYGNIKPCEKCFEKGTQYANAVNVFCNNEKKLLDLLNYDELKIFKELVNASDEISAVTGMENFKIGFRLGVDMMCNCLMCEDDRIFKDFD